MIFATFLLQHPQSRFSFASMTGDNKIVLIGQLHGVYAIDNGTFFARFNFEGHEIDVPCDQNAFHGIRFGDAILSFEVTSEKPSIIVIEQTV